VMAYGYYIIGEDGRTPRPATLEDWTSNENLRRRPHVAKEMIGDVLVSTVFLGIDHAHDSGIPLLFETMIFGGEHDQWQDRCSTWSGAEDMHAVAVEMVKASQETNKDNGAGI